LQLSIKFLTWNLENFFLLATSSATTPLKPKEKVETIAKVFKDINPDIAFLTEVGGKESLDHFNEIFLNEEYEVLLKKGNSNRGIENGYLIKKTFLDKYKLIFDYKSHANKPINFLYPHEHLENKKVLNQGYRKKYHSHKMSRDLADLRFFKLEDQNKRQPIFIFLGVHLKSKLDKDGIDWQGTKRRRAEMAYTVEQVQKLKSRYHDLTPIFLTGDFNGECHQDRKDPEFVELIRVEDFLDFTEQLNLPREECFSFIGIDKARKPFGVQLDYFFLNKASSHYLIKQGCGFYRYKNDTGAIFPTPQNPGARFALPSDHYPLVTEWTEDILDIIIDS